MGNKSARKREIVLKSKVPWKQGYNYFTGKDEKGMVIVSRFKSTSKKKSED